MFASTKKRIGKCAKTTNLNKNMQAIITKYIPATNTRGTRIKATCSPGSITIPMHLRNGIQLCKDTEGTPGGYRMGLLASLLKAATVEI